MNQYYFMQMAYQEALNALDEGEVPVGAVIEKNGVVMGKGYNRVEGLRDVTAHAEIVAISAATQNLSSWRLNGCTLYVTLEPCLMCLGAIVHSRIDSIVYAAPDPRAGAVDTFFYQQEIERSYNYFPAITSGILKDECSALLKAFFQTIRKKN
ncbi:nucleoside deaminase [Chitinispirillales bacterium ANBcel5]|uniref:nucleoside deaminase n=1 Tax=Cellulosispirillum alkaliphilum TaxID=3039283 RepID=UPI002A4F105C|nr:nucleoside deaminase [Chitinispirillales bacterium ANBcel5]